MDEFNCPTDAAGKRAFMRAGHLDAVFAHARGGEVQLASLAWATLVDFVLPENVDLEEEKFFMRVFVDRGGVELAYAELGIMPWRHFYEDVVKWVCTYLPATKRFFASGIHRACISRIASNEASPSTMSVVRNLSANPELRAGLKADGLLVAVLPLLRNLANTDTDSRRTAFRAASIVVRLMGESKASEEDDNSSSVAPPAHLLRGHARLIANLLDVLNGALDAGPSGAYMNMRLDPYMITMDVLILAAIEENRHLLAGHLHVLVKALVRRGPTNKKMLHDLVRIFVHMTLEPQCRSALMSFKQEICGVLSSCIRPGRTPIEMVKLAQLVYDFLDPSQLTSAAWYTAAASKSKISAFVPGESGPITNVGGKEGPGLLGGVWRRLSSTVRRSPRNSSHGLLRTLLGAPSHGAPPRRHIVLLYRAAHPNQEAVVTFVDEVLRRRGWETWADWRDLHDTVQTTSEAVSSAIRNARAVLVFADRSLNTSAPKQRELELANMHRVPVVFLHAEEGFTPMGWLAALMNGAPAAPRPANNIRTTKELRASAAPSLAFWSVAEAQNHMNDLSARLAQVTGFFPPREGGAAASHGSGAMVVMDSLVTRTLVDLTRHLAQVNFLVGSGSTWKPDATRVRAHNSNNNSST